MRFFYRPEIEGLRAIAVIAVIFYHAKINIHDKQFLEGGFIGVDIFFVISGYLISLIIFRELFDTGSISLKYFYQRRIRRIFPALIFVLLISLPLAYLFLLPSSLIDFSKSIIYSITFISNIYFYSTELIYTDVNALLKPFLHTWSLSVEGQFYILFPIIILILFKYYKSYLIYFLLFIFTVSIFYADWNSKNYPSLNFYFFQSRFWELSLGSILAYFEIVKGRNFKNKLFANSFVIIGLFLIFYSFFFFTEDTFHPSFYTLLPITGISLIIWFADKDQIITKFLSKKIIVGIGAISYSLYLFHYPIFAFARITNFTDGDLFKKIFIIIIVFSFSILSYFFIEKPFRNKDYKFKNIFFILLLAIILLIVFSLSALLNKGYETRIQPIFDIDILSSKEIFLKNNDCFYDCTFNSFGERKVFIVGDSHAGYLIQNLKDRLIEKNLSLITLTKPISGCLFYPGFYPVDKKTNKALKDCDESYHDMLKKKLSLEKNAIIIFAGRFPLHLNNEIFNNKEGGIEQNTAWTVNFVSNGQYKNIKDSFITEVKQLAENNQIILVYPIPEVGWHVPNKLFNHLKSLSKNVNKKKLFKSEYITTSYQVYKNRTKSSFEMLDLISGKNIFKVYPHQLFCNTMIDQRCIAHDDKHIYYADEHHPTFQGTTLINNLILEKIDKIVSDKY